MRRLLLPLLAAATALTGLAVATSASSATPSQKWAVIVGINKHAGKTHSNYGAVGDAGAFRDLLLKNGWPSDHILTLTDADANQSMIRSAMQWLVDRSTPESFSVFHYSGHIKQISGDKDRDGEALDEYLWPSDNKFISDGEFGNYMRALRGYAWIDIAACEAAGMDDQIASSKRIVTASSQEDEKSYEVTDWKRSLFTGLQLDRAHLPENKADKNGDGKLSIQEMFGYAQVQAPFLSQRQAAGPQHPYIAGGDGTQWILASVLPSRPYQCNLVRDLQKDAMATGMAAPDYADIVDADIASGKNTVTAVIRVRGMSGDWRSYGGAEYRLSFTMGGTNQQLIARRSTLNGDRFSLASTHFGTTRLSDVTGTFDHVAKTVRIVAPRTAFIVDPKWRWFTDLKVETFTTDTLGGAFNLDRADTATSDQVYYDRDPSCVRPN